VAAVQRQRGDRARVRHAPQHLVRAARGRRGQGPAPHRAVFVAREEQRQVIRRQRTGTAAGASDLGTSGSGERENGLVCDEGVAVRRHGGHVPAPHLGGWTGDGGQGEHIGRHGEQQSGFDSLR
jgi:hypothetical protein